VGTALLVPGRLLNALATLNPRGMAAFEALGRASGVLLLAVGAGTAAVGVGLLRRRRWAWWLAIALFAVDACGDLVTGFVTREWVRALAGVAISSAFLVALSRPGVRGYFVTAPGPTASPARRPPCEPRAPSLRGPARRRGDR